MGRLVEVRKVRSGILEVSMYKPIVVFQLSHIYMYTCEQMVELRRTCRRRIDKKGNERLFLLSFSFFFV